MRSLKLLLLFISCTVGATAQYLPQPENMELVDVPRVDASIPEEVKPYTESRTARLIDWYPGAPQMIISTRFANTAQLHLVKQPMGVRKQMTFFEEPVRSATVQPKKGDYLIYGKDIGGNEFAQLFRFDFATGKSTLLTDGGRSQNGGVEWNDAADKIIFSSTARNGADRDVYIMDPMDPASRKLLIEMKGGGWGAIDWSSDEKKVLIGKYSSINESSVWEYDIPSKTLKMILPKKEERTVYMPVKYSKDGKEVYIITTKGSEFRRPAKLNIATGELKFLVTGINWDISGFTISDDYRHAAFYSNEAGVERLYLLDLVSGKYEPVDVIPTGLINGINWHPDNETLGLSLGNARSGGDAYTYNINNKQLVRWTESEAGGMDLSSLPLPELIKWKSFDGLEISGFLYRAPKRFTGKRPVIINIHGGPEGQSQPGFQGRNNYYMNELGIAMIYPNVRGSSGFGKTFLDMDNGMKREESVKDIGALIDWIAKQPDLDASRIMVMGGSYGGYMTLASAVHYNDRIRCAVDIVGISHFGTFLKYTEDYRRDLRRVEYGDERDPAMAKFFDEISPLNNAEKIRKPLFIVQGKNDPRVPYSEARQMAERVKANNGEVWFLTANDEGHGFAKKNNQDYYFYTLVQFVKQYLL